MQTSFSPVQLADPDTAKSAAILRTGIVNLTDRRTILGDFRALDPPRFT